MAGGGVVSWERGREETFRVTRQTSSFSTNVVLYSVISIEVFRGERPKRYVRNDFRHHRGGGWVGEARGGRGGIEGGGGIRDVRGDVSGARKNVFLCNF